ncbi:MAG TPA: hypothetical protein VEJ36_06935 [Nitrososphaerales archaeon]|nr:hypothetical protein [Nitrososphaerales archaeon]
MPFSLQQEILELYKDLSPSDAYIMGFNDRAGHIFIPTEKNLRAARRKIAGLRSRARSEIELKVLNSISAKLDFSEPQPILDDIVEAIFAHLAKEGANDEHLLSLLRDSSEAVEATKARFRSRRVPVGVKALTLYRLDSIIEILEAVRKKTRNRELKHECDELKDVATSFVGMFSVKGFGAGEFESVERIFKRQGSELGRERFYRRALKDGLDYWETPEQLEKKALSWIDEELPRFRRVMEKLAKQYSCKATPEGVEKKMNERMKFDSKKLIRTTLKIRRVVERLVDQDVSRITPKYRTRVIETPSYLTGTIPTGAAQFFDTFTSKPFQVYFQTTDPKRDPDRTVASILNLLVHEEYGHCVHHSNSSVGFVKKLSPLELLPSANLGDAVSEGVAFNREIEFLEASKRLEKKSELSKAERDYAEVMEGFGGLKLINLELEFWTRRWRIVRFLRVIGDVRVNSGKQSLLDFIDWANGYTSIPKSSVYHQLFPAHLGTFPGYATSYAVIGEEIRSVERGVKDEKKRVKLSTYLCSIGFPPRSIYNGMLKSYAAKLK